MPWEAFSQVEIDTQYVRERILSYSLKAKRNAFYPEKSILDLQLAHSVYDWKNSFYYKYRDNQENSLNSFFYDRSKTKSLGFQIEKKTPTGTRFFGNFSRIQQMGTPSSELPISIEQERFEYQGELKVEQALLRNAFGAVDRKHVKAAEKNLTAAKLQQKKNLAELLAKGLTLYWNAYTAREVLNARESIKKEYAHLESVLKKKNSLGFNDQVDVEKAQAEYLNQSREVEYAKSAYNTATTELLRFLNMDPKEKILIKVENNIPDPINRKDFSHVDWRNTRSIKIVQEQLEAAKLHKKATRSSTLPALNLVASYRSASSGGNSSEVFRQFRGREYPDYSVGVEFHWNFWSKTNKAKRAYGEVLFQERELLLEEEKKRKRDEVEKAWLDLEKTHQAAIDSQLEIQVRNSVVKRQKKSFQQGRLDTSQLIIDYNSLFFSQLRYAQAVESYNLALMHLKLALNTLLSEK